MFLNTDSRLLRQIRYYLKPTPKIGGLGLKLFLLSACIFKNHVIPYGQDQRKRVVHYFNLIIVSGLFFKLICANNNTFKNSVKNKNCLMASVFWKEKGKEIESVFRSKTLRIPAFQYGLSPQKS